MVPMGAYPTADGHLNVAAMGDFTTFCALVDEPALAEDPRYADFASRVAHRAELDADLARALAKRTTAEWVERFWKSGVPAGRPSTAAHRRSKALRAIASASATPASCCSRVKSASWDGGTLGRPIVSA